MDAAQVSQAVHDKYSSIAQAACSPAKSSKPSCCKPLSQSNGTTTPQPNNHSQSPPSNNYASRVASSFGYSPSQLSSLPPSTNLGLSCGNPLALTNVSPNETIVDLGSGGGLDCLLSAKAMVKASNDTGAAVTGKVYGIDSSSDMINLARRNVKAAQLPPRTSTSPDDNANSNLIDFINSPITTIPLPTSTANLIISNCVLNLLPDALKPTAFHEIHRLLAPGGRVAISDILSLKPLPDSIRNNVALMVGCVAGAASVDEYRTWMVQAGFDEQKIVFKKNGSDLNAYKLTPEEREAQTKNGNGNGCCGGGGGCGANVREDGQLFDEEVRDVDFNEWVAAFEIYAVK